MYLHNFAEEVKLRFGALRLIRGDWRQYTQNLSTTANVSGTASLSLSAVNIEEHGDRTPINYVLPPGVSRSLDTQEAQSIQQNEQALAMKVKALQPSEAKAIYKNTAYDLRRYKSLQLFAHAENLVEDFTNTQNGDISLFLRLGSDYRNNYYEYSVPLKLTKEGRYNDRSEEDRRRVWCDENFIDINLEELVRLKQERNRLIAEGQTSEASPFKLFLRPDKQKSRNSIAILGNPSLSNVKTIMIGVRNNSGEVRSIEVWVNELRLGDYHEEGGWAVNSNVGLQLAELASINFRGQYSTSGFGGIDQSLAERQIDDRKDFNLSANVELGKLLPEKVKLSCPVYYSLAHEESRPEYNPSDEDVKLDDALESMKTKHQVDSILNYAVRRRVVQSLSLNNVNLGIRSEKAMPYDPANFSLNYAQNHTREQSPEIEYRTQSQWQFGLNYDYSPTFLPLQPFKFIDKNNKGLRSLRDYGITLWPSRISFQTSLIRNYDEEQIRNQMDNQGGMKLPVSFSQQFLWYRKFNLAWNLLPHLNFNMTTGTDARIEEPHVQVNRELNPDDYAVWKEEVQRSIKDLGTPMRYGQTARLSYVFPSRMIEMIDWISAQANYSSSYNWQLGALLKKEGEKLPNSISNQLNLDANVQMNLHSFYQKFDYIKDLERRLKGEPQRRRHKKRKPKQFKQDVQLIADSTLHIKHGLASDDLIISIKDSLNRNIALQPLKITKDYIEFRSSDSLKFKLKLKKKPEEEPNKFLQMITDYSLKTLLMVQNVSLSYRHTATTQLTSFLPNAGSAFGQSKRGGVLTPGLGFAFGLAGEDFINEALEREWLINNERYVQPAVFSQAKICDVKLTLNPISDLHINLTMNHTDNRRSEHFYMYKGSPVRPGGDFSMTTIGLKHIFSMPSLEDNYADANFDTFLHNRQVIAQRIAQRMLGKRFPEANLLNNNHYSGQTITEANLSLDENASAVLLPAFRSAYTLSAGANKVSLQALPSLFSMLPNWDINYTGLSRLSWLKDCFSNISLKHSYRGIYRIDNYGSYPSWVEVEGGAYGFLIPNTDTEKPQLSFANDIASITFQENFFPVIGVDVSFKNGLTLGSQWRRSRAMTLNLSSYRLIETNSNEVSASISYRIADVKSLFKPKKRGRRHRKRQEYTSAKGLSLRLDYSYGHSISLMRNLQDYHSQASAGTKDSRISFSAEYELSRMLSLRAYYDWTRNHPLVSTSAFPMSNSSYGISLRFNLLH